MKCNNNKKEKDMAEYWDIYNKNFEKINKRVKRGDKLEDDEYHLVINAWIVNSKGEFLITQRVATKPHPLMWECTGGSAIEGDNPLDACVREIKEEVGLDIDVKTAKHIGTTIRYYKNCPDILDVWLFKSDADISEITIQEEEVNDVMWADKKKILELHYAGKFEANAFFGDVISKSEF